MNAAFFGLAFLAALNPKLLGVDLFAGGYMVISGLGTSVGLTCRQRRRSSRVQALDWLPRDVGDDLEVLIEVQDGKPGEFRDSGDDQVGQGGRAVLAPVSEQRENLDSPVFDDRSQVLHGHRPQRRQPKTGTQLGP